MLTVLTWLWAQPGGRATYTAQHVNIWADMVRRNLSLPHRLACVTDMPEGVDPSIAIIAPPGDFEDVRIPSWGADKPQCLRRIALFRPDAAEIFGERFVSMDTDCVVGASLDPLFDRDEDFVMYRAGYGDRPYNGSMLMMTAGARRQVYDRFTPEGAVAAGQQYVGSDQAWISHVLGWGEATWQVADGVLWYGDPRNAEAPEPRIMFFPGSPKPWDVAEIGLNPWISENYRRSPRGRCLVLGYSQTVWADVAKALDAAPFDAVISSPEAAEHWPGEILAIAKSDGHADRLVLMHGFEETVFCGRTEKEAA